LRMPSRRPPGRAAFGGPRRSWRKASAGPAAGRGASIATAQASSGPRTIAPPAAHTRGDGARPPCQGASPTPPLSMRRGSRESVRRSRGLRRTGRRLPPLKPAPVGRTPPAQPGGKRAPSALVAGGCPVRPPDEIRDEGAQTSVIERLAARDPALDVRRLTSTTELRVRVGDCAFASLGTPTRS
jgi:hypothetical protein